MASICRSLGVRSVLDLGCGRGDIANAPARSGFDAIGCDADAQGVRIIAGAQSLATLRPLGVYDDPSALGRNDFDAVISTEVIEYLLVGGFDAAD